MRTNASGYLTCVLTGENGNERMGMKGGNMKGQWLSWLALLFAAAALIVSFVFIGQAEDTAMDLEVAIDAYNAAIGTLNEVIDDYNRINESYTQIVEDYDEIAEDYWQWRAQQDAT